jgi:phosphoesterase RecJ-like protein
MINGSDFQKAIGLIGKSDSVLITTHIKPDGDACGCCLALAETLASLGKSARILFLSPMPQWYEFLFKDKVPVLGADVAAEQLMQGRFGKFDLIVIVDTNSNSQLPDFDKYLKQIGTPVLVIDHHKTGDSLGDVELVDSSAAAASSIVLDLLRYAGWPVTAGIAEGLFAGIASDTGWFHFTNTDSTVFRCCAELIDAGVNPSEIFHNVYQNFSPPRFKLMTAVLNSLELHFEGRYAAQHLTKQDFEMAGASYTDTENLIDECQRISTVEVAALFSEMKDGRIRCSLRSRGAVDVCKIAQKFDGGGHPSAAGAYLPGPVDNAKNLILNEVKIRLEK